MARPLRMNVADGWYHVWGRGIDRRCIYGDDHDRYQFLKVLGRSTERYRIKIHAYVLMDNHYHLIVQTPEANLSKAMQWITTSYSMWHNRRHGRVGPLFQGRYGSKLVEDSSWAYELSVYLHLNPVHTAAYGWGKREQKAQRAGIARAPKPEEVTTRLKAIRECRWSSYRSYAGYEQGLEWVERKDLLRRAKRGKRQDQTKAYRNDVQGWIKQGVDPAKREELCDGIAVGSTEFIERLKKMIGKPAREEKGKLSVRRRKAPEDVIGVIEDVKGESWSGFRKKHGDWGKGHVYWFLRECCGMTLRGIGEVSGGIDYAAVSDVLRRYEKKLDESRQLLTEHKLIRAQILNLET